MTVLYHGSGASDFEVDSKQATDSGIVSRAIALLRARDVPDAAEFLQGATLEFWDSHNGFYDEFLVLIAYLPLAGYVEATQRFEVEYHYNQMFRQIAETFGELERYPRFIDLRISGADVLEVEMPVLKKASLSVQKALEDAQVLIGSNGALSGFDRLYTALHGYIRGLASEVDATADDASIVSMFRTIRQKHPSFNQDGPGSEPANRVVMAMATIVDALQPLRNRGSLAHPNENLLQGPEAYLATNAIRTLLHYLEAKRATSETGTSDAPSLT